MDDLTLTRSSSHFKQSVIWTNQKNISLATHLAKRFCRFTALSTAVEAWWFGLWCTCGNRTAKKKRKSFTLYCKTGAGIHPQISKQTASSIFLVNHFDTCTDLKLLKNVHSCIFSLNHIVTDYWSKHLIPLQRKAFTLAMCCIRYCRQHLHC